MATADPPDAAESSGDGATFAYSLDKVVAATWLEAAAPTEERSQKDLIEANSGDQDEGECL